MKTDPKAFFTLLDHAQELTRQRDALLAASKALLEYWDNDTPVWGGSDVAQELRNAIALCSSVATAEDGCSKAR